MGPYPGTKVSRRVVGDSPVTESLDEMFSAFRANADSRMLPMPIF
jgi:hypothetical protein